MRLLRALTLAVLTIVIVDLRFALFDPEAVTVGSTLLAAMGAVTLAATVWVLITPIADWIDGGRQ